MSSYRITEMKWRVSDFVYIAKKFEAYESGKEKPSAFEEVEDGKKEEKAGDESWDGTELMENETESFYDNNLRKYGIRTKKGRILVEPKYEQLQKSEKNYIAQNGNTAFLLGNLGNIIKSKSYNGKIQIYSNLTVRYNITREKTEYWDENVELFEEDDLANNGPIKKKFFFNHTFSLEVTSSDDKRTYDERKRDRQNYELKKKEYLEKISSNYKSQGYE
jgi:hypothetical protein